MTSTAEVKTICNLLIDYLPVIKELITTLIIIAGIAMVCLLVITFISIKILNDLEDISSESTALKKLLFKIYFAHRITMKSKHGIDLDKAAENIRGKDSRFSGNNLMTIVKLYLVTHHLIQTLKI